MPKFWLFQHPHEFQALLGAVKPVHSPASPDARLVADDEDDELELDRITQPPASVSTLELFFNVHLSVYIISSFQLDYRLTTKCIGPVKDQKQVSYLF